jgi:hypothetical protein
MRKKRILQDAFGLGDAVVDCVDFDDEAGAIVVAVRPRAKSRSRCGRCARRSPRYDHGEGRRWRALDLGTTKVFLEGPALRIPGVSGHPFRLNPDTHSGVFGHLRRRADRRLCE